MALQFQQPVRDVSRQLGLGKLLYRSVHQPKRFLKTTWQRGLNNRWQAHWGQQQMEKAAQALPLLAVQPTASQFDIHFMTGRKYWYQTCFCAYSMQQQAQVNLRPVIHDDGSLEEWQMAELLRVFPNACFVFLPEMEERLGQVLPEATFPYLREWRRRHPLIRKLIDFHAGQKGWKLFLDSDMLFFRPPTFLLEWLSNPQIPCYMVDVANAYGYSEALLQELSHGPLPQRLNSGVLGLNSEAIAWDTLEYWLKTLVEREGSHYHLDQALACLLLSGQEYTIAPPTDYLLLPDRQESQHPTVVMHHYVAESKAWYFRFGWRAIASIHP